MASQPSSESNLTPGAKVGGGRFVLVRLLGKGGMGVVWLARDERLQEDVALKFLPAEIRSDAIALDDMRRETQRSRKLTHLNIIRIHDFFEAPGEAPFISMEFVDGPNLNGLRAQQENRMFPWNFLAPLVQQLCAALEYAHGEKVIHRDLKPANMMLDSKGRLKLADFGIAAVMSDSMSRVSLQHATSGTLTHMSPQQLDGKAPRVTDDIYSLGATLYELLTGKPPFHTGDIAHQVRNLSVQPVEDRLREFGLANDIPPPVAAMIMACLAKEPEQRPQSAHAVANWIGLTQARSDSRSTPAHRPDASSRLRWGAIFTVALAFAGAGWIWKNHTPAGMKSDQGKISATGASAADNSGRVIFEEKFENIDAVGVPRGWQWGLDDAGSGAKVSLKEINGNHFVQMEATGTNGVLRIALEHGLALEKSWKALRITFRVKTQNLKINPTVEISGAHFNEAWTDAKTNYFQWNGTTPIQQDKDWVAIESVEPIPAEATRVQFVFHLTKASGTMAFDDLRVSAIEGKREENVSLLLEPGFTSIFNGHDLSGWEEFPDWNEGWEKWVVKDGAITSVVKMGQNPALLFWRGGLVDNFELRFSYKLGHVVSDKQGGCAVVYRGNEHRFVVPASPTNAYNLFLRGGPLRRGRGGNVTELGQNVLARDRNGQELLTVVGSLGDPVELLSAFNDADWNDCALIVQDHHHVYKVNGRTMLEFRDENVTQRTRQGELGLYLWNDLERFPPLPVQFKNIRLKRLTAP